MKFLYILAVFCIPIPARSQSTPYKNLEKYWFYRYRLVNDFMKIGRGLGESIPAQQRTLGGDSPNDESDPNSLKFEEGTIALGTYIGVLATEHRQLDRYAYSKTARHMSWTLLSLH